MHNMCTLIGRLTKEIETKNIDGKEFAVATIAVQRSYKNEEGIYETDSIPVILWNGIAQNTKEYCHKGDLLGVKGRLQSEIIEMPIGDEYRISIIAEKITFLSSKKEGE